MMSMARGLRLGMTWKRKKKSDSDYYDESKQQKRSKKRDSSIYNEDDETKQQQLGQERRTSFILSKCSTGSEKQDGSKQEDDDDDYTKAHCDYFNHNSLNHVQHGETLNLSEVLFTEQRDFLVTYEDRNRPVQAKHLEGKVIVLHFVPLVRPGEMLKRFVLTLVDVYTALHSNAAFEVVFIGVKSAARHASKRKKLRKRQRKRFELLFSMMPWPAIPFSHLKPLEYYASRLRIPVDWMSGTRTYSLVVDPRGMVLQPFADHIFFDFGAEAYPFSAQRINFLQSQDKKALDHLSMITLLASPERDYLINNKNQAVPLHTLEDKIVGLYFYQNRVGFTRRLKEAYDQFSKAGEFEIVLVNIPHTFESCGYESELSFWGGFRNMPWLALPFKDPKWITLNRIFKLAEDPESEVGPVCRLVIVGPQGKFIEPYGDEIFMEFGISAYPFTRQSVAQLQVKSIQKLKLNEFWEPNTSFIQKNGSQVKVSQLVGKKIIVVYEGYCPHPDKKFWRKLKKRYLQMKNTDDEFEVIYICEKRGCAYGEHVAKAMSWLRHPPISLGGSKLSDWLLDLLGIGPALIAFDQSGRIVRRTIHPSIQRGNMDFPFHTDDLETDALRILVRRYGWERSWLDLELF